MARTRGSRGSGTWFSTATTIASGSNAAAEQDVSGFLPLKIHIGSGWTAANLGFKSRPLGSSTSRVVRDDTGTPVQISGINTTVGGVYSVPVTPGLEGIKFLTLYKKNTTAATTSVVTQTGGAVSLWIEGVG